MKCHQAMMSFEKRRKREDESIDRMLDDLESLRRRSDPEESTNRRNFSIASKFIDWVRSDNLRTMLATYYTQSKDNAPTPEEMRQKSKEYLLMKPKKYSFSEGRNMQGRANYKGRQGTSLKTTWTNVGHAQIVDQRIIMWRIARYTGVMKSLGYAPEEEAMSQTEEHEFYSVLIIKIGARCFFCNQEGNFRIDGPFFWEAVKNQNHPKQKLALAAVPNTRNRQAENDLNNKEAAGGELLTKTMKAVMQNKDATGAETRNSLEINYERAAAEAINKLKQDLATK